MKLSQKLLGLAGLAMADYACCPYDDYGMPDPLCAAVLREKTPFEGSSRWMDNECKAWESNVDATYEGNAIGGCAPDNWGSCGFQRHFPWRDFATGEAEALSLNTFTQLDVHTAGAPNTNAYSVSGGVVDSTNYNLGGLPFLGGMCKLFVPVPAANIVQVQIAGVHKQGNNHAQYPAQVTASTGALTLAGTAYCFSVANVAEARDNTNNINNGNVAGEGQASGTANGRLDLFAGLNSLSRQAGVAFGVGYGSALTDQSDPGTDENGEVKAGNNFDVVAHFDDTFCEGRWTATDMQMTGDENSGGAVDYPINQASGFSHAHTDIMDKRHNEAGYGPLYTTSNTDYLQRTASVTYNSVAHAGVDLVRWPNSGAWAGFYSLVACVNAGQSPALGANVWADGTRNVAMSVSASDYRINEATDCTSKFANFRFNVRQVGSDVELCGPGQLPDGGTKRCTWNWNYDASANFGSSNANDAEGFFDRSEQMNIDSWTRKRRAALGRTAGANNVAAVLKKAILTFTFRDQDGTGLLAAAQTLTSDVGATLMTITPDTNSFKAKLTCVNTAAATAQRDNFPSCFTGDEIHFNLAYTPSSLTSHRAAVSPWFSSVASDFTSESV